MKYMCCGSKLSKAVKNQQENFNYAKSKIDKELSVENMIKT